MPYLLFRHTHRSFVVICLATGVIAGVILGLSLDLWVFHSSFWLAVCALLVLVSLRHPCMLFLGVSFIAGAIIGVGRISSDIGERDYLAQFIDQRITVTGTIYEDPETDAGATTFRINNLIIGSSEKQRPTTGSLYVKLYGSEPLERSSRVTIVGKLSTGFGSFAGAIYSPSLRSISKPDPPDLALEFRNGFASAVKQFIPAPEVDLSLGYLLGQRRALPGDLLDTIKTVGLTHIIVASGYNLSILVSLSRRIFKRVSRFAVLLFGALLIIAFMSITGFTPSMVRAGLVSGLSLAVWFVGRKFHPIKLLILVASATLILNPFYIQDLGWILSFLSFFGVLVVCPLLTAFFYGSRKPNFVAGVIIETISAQISCLPILLFLFGTTSLASLPANILIVPTIPATMLLTFLTGATSFLSPLASLLGWAATKLLDFHIWVINFFGSLDWSIVSIPSQNPLTLVAYPVIVTALIFIWKKTNYRFMTSSMLE